MAFSSTIKGQTAGVGGTKKIFGTWDAASVTTGTVTWKGTTQPYNIVGGGVVQSTARTTAWSGASCKITAGTLVVECESSAAGWWWVELQ